MNRLLVLILFTIGLSASAQDLTGIWRGHFQSTGTASRMLQMLGHEDRYKFEVQLDQSKKAFSGVTYSYKTTVFYGKASCKGTIHTGTKKVMLEEMKILEVRMAGGDACIMTCFLQYSNVGGEEFLEGTYTSMNTRDSSNCGSGSLILRKVPTSDFYKEPFLVQREKEALKKTKKPPVTSPSERTTAPKESVAKKPAVKPPVKKPDVKRPDVAKKRNGETPPDPKPADNVKRAEVDSEIEKEKKTINTGLIPQALSTRKNELVKTITTDANQLQISLYDNGTIDNDTVSVYVNNKLVIHKQRLTAKPITITLDLDEEQDTQELVMVAENLGEIPLILL
jgi:hypothetical protein